jgi:uncharacterized membrane protein YeaQ/YmgE (transglycosylase-associated protein family)
MSIIVSMLAGAIVGWVSLALPRFNEGRGKLACVFIGAVGGFIGVKAIAPMFLAPGIPGELVNGPILVVVLLVASACLVVGDWVGKRWDV